MCLHTISITSPARKVSPEKEKRTHVLNVFTRTNMTRGDDMDNPKYPCCLDCKVKSDKPDYSDTQCFYCNKGCQYITADKRYLRMFGVLGVMPGCLGCDNQPAKTIPDGCHSCCQTSIFTPGSNYKKTDKPPLVIKPRWMMLEHRNREIIEAMHRRADACMDNSEPITLDPKWIMELFDNNQELLARCKP